MLLICVTASSVDVTYRRSIKTSRFWW